MVVDTSHCPGYWLYEHEEPRGVDWCVTLISMWCNDGDLKPGILLADATDIKLTEEEIQYLEEPYKARSVFGHT